MYKQIGMVAIALVLSLGLVLTAFAQNVTTSDNQTTTEEVPLTTLNGSDPEVSIIGVTPGDEGGLTGNETVAPQNLTQVKEEAIDLLDTAETNIEDARDLIRSLQEALAQAQGDKGQVIVEQANESATDIIDIVKENVTVDQPVIDQVGNASDTVVQVINATVNGTITPEQSENVTEVADAVVDVIEEATEPVDNTTVTTQVDTAMIRLLTGLVDAQDYTALPVDQRDELKADLAETIADLADNSADRLSEDAEGG